MSNLNVQQKQKLNTYLKNNPQVSREKAIQLLFGGMATSRTVSSKGLAVDAWLANWDAVCSGNTLLKNGNAVRVDFGGTLNFRARGAKKQFSSEVPELSTLLDPKINPESANVFKNMTRKDLISSLERVQSVTDDDIQKIYSSTKTYIHPEIFEAIKNRKTYLNYVLYEAKKAK